MKSASDDDDRDELFNVVVFYSSGWHDYNARNVSAKTAVEMAKKLTDFIETFGGEAFKVMITDSGDHTNFLWEKGKGIIYPTAEQLKETP